MFRQYLDDNGKNKKKDYEVSYIRRVKEAAKAKKNKSKKQDKSTDNEEVE
jgi:hypothetical protein